MHILSICVGGVKIGNNCIIYSPITNCIDETSLMFIEIGDYVQITAGVVILAHDYSYSVGIRACDKLCRKQKVTRIGNNVFIGMNAIILMGANIGDNVIIGAGAVVAGMCESNSVYVGNPARRLCSLEEYVKRGEEQFIEGAKVWCRQYYERKGRYPDIADMGIYKTLFIEKTEKNVEMNFKDSDFKKVILKSPKQFNSVGELMAYYRS